MNVPLPYKDFTIKACISNPKTIESILAKLHAHFLGTDHQKDTYFNIANGKLKYRQGIIEHLITHYERTSEDGIEKTIVYRYDLNPSPDQVMELYSQHKTVAVIEKQRKIFYIGNVKIHLDQLAEQYFVEIEAIDRTNTLSAEELRRQCLDIKEKLLITEKDLIKTGYFDDSA